MNGNTIVEFRVSVISTVDGQSGATVLCRDSITVDRSRGTLASFRKQAEEVFERRCLNQRNCRGVEQRCGFSYASYEYYGGVRVYVTLGTFTANGVKFLRGKKAS